MRNAVIYQRRQNRRHVVPALPYAAHVVPALPYVPVLVELRQFPVIHILQSLLGRVTATGPLQDNVKESTQTSEVVFLFLYHYIHVQKGCIYVH